MKKDLVYNINNFLVDNTILRCDEKKISNIPSDLFLRISFGKYIGNHFFQASQIEICETNNHNVISIHISIPKKAELLISGVL